LIYYTKEQTAWGATIIGHKHTKIKAAVRHDRAENYILTSLVAFAVTVIAAGVYLKWTEIKGKNE
jgi:flagellin-like protein